MPSRFTHSGRPRSATSLIFQASSGPRLTLSLLSKTIDRPNQSSTPATGSSGLPRNDIRRTYGRTGGATRHPRAQNVDAFDLHRPASARSEEGALGVLTRELGLLAGAGDVADDLVVPRGCDRHYRAHAERRHLRAGHQFLVDNEVWDVAAWAC